MLDYFGMFFFLVICRDREEQAIMLVLVTEEVNRLGEREWADTPFEIVFGPEIEHDHLMPRIGWRCRSRRRFLEIAGNL
jgi:hypothetical protein